MDIAVRNFKDFLLLFNSVTEECFVHCVNQLGERDLTQHEVRCVDVCARKFVYVNQKTMQVFLEVQPQIAKRRAEMSMEKANLVELNSTSVN